jgi:hypothetical protein
LFENTIDFFEVCQRFTLRRKIVFREINEGGDRTKIARVDSLLLSSGSTFAAWDGGAHWR